MAKAKVIEPPPQPPRRVLLTLTEGEADFLMAMCARTCGDPRRSPRKYERRITSALTEALGYAFWSTDAHNLIAEGSRITFSNY